MSSKKWFFYFLLGSFILLLASAGIIAYIDPFFHYHQPVVNKFFYPLNNERSQCDGIAKHFDYNAIITGTSMAENFKTSEADELFDLNFIKLPLSGGSYKEFNNLLTTAFNHNKNISLVIWTLDMGRFFDDKDNMRFDLGTYPTYLYNANPFDDVYYLLNRDILFTRCYQMMKDRRHGVKSGITSFDRFGYWMPNYIGQFGKDTVLKDVDVFSVPTEIKSITENERASICTHISQNVTSLCATYSGTTFYFIISPYSAAWWGDQWQSGLLDRWIDAEQLVIEQLLEHDNIKLFSFNCFTDITADLNNYKDATHYGEWINSLMLRNMADDIGLLSKENYMDYINEERTLYSIFDYNSLFLQDDLEDSPPELDS